MASKRMVAWVAGAALGVGALAGVAIAGASLAGGGTEEAPGAAVGAVTSTMSPFGTPRPPSSGDPAGPVITQAPVPTAAEPTSPPSVTISGVEIPLPPGSHYYYGGCCEAKTVHRVWIGDSEVRFDEYGLWYSEIAGGDHGLFSPTLDALWALSQEVETPSPANIMIDSDRIPFPAGSYYRKVDVQSGENFEVYTIHFHYSVALIYGTAYLDGGVTPEDAAQFQQTRIAVERLPLRTD